MILKVKSLSGNLPEYKTEGSSGMDVKAYIDEAILLEPGKRVLVPTGLYIEIPNGYEIQIRGRSGLAVNYGIGLTNGIGTIDSDYRGEIKVSLINLGEEPFIIENGDRIAQMIVCRYEKVDIQRVEIIGDTERGEGGFGHTGTK